MQDSPATTVESHQEGEDKGTAKHVLSCYQCRARKLKCDRLSPCTRCSQSGVECRFPESRQRPVNVARRPRVKEIEARLMHLEHQFQHGEPAASQVPLPGSSLIETGRVEGLPPQSIVEELTSLYFARLYWEAPMQHPERYMASLHLPTHMQPPMCLQYAILALAASLSRVHEQLSLPFYYRARNYIQLDEMKDDGRDIMSVAHAQCWVLLGNFEAQHLWFSRAALSASRAVRLAQMLGLHNIETTDAHGITLPPPRDWCAKEERRRTLWVVYCTDLLTSSTTGWPALMDTRHIRTLLPVSEESFRLGLEQPSVTLQQALRDGSVEYSHLACRVLSSQLFHECLEHIFGKFPDDDDGDLSRDEFWKRHHSLNNRLAIMFMVLPDGLRCPEHIGNQDAVFISLKLHTASVCICRAEVAEIKKTDKNSPQLHSITTRSLTAAQEIYTTVARLGDVDASFQNLFIAFAAFMAALVFLEDYATSHSRQSEERLDALMNFMMLISKTNPGTASLTVQIAQEMHKLEIDKFAMKKVEDIMSKLDPDASLLGQQDRDSGGVIFCPLQARP